MSRRDFFQIFCFIFNVSLGSAPKRKNFDIQRNTRVCSGGQFTSNRLSNDHNIAWKIAILRFPTFCITKAMPRLTYWAWSMRLGNNFVQKILSIFFAAIQLNQTWSPTASTKSCKFILLGITLINIVFNHNWKRKVLQAVRRDISAESSEGFSFQSMISQKFCFFQSGFLRKGSERHT